MTQPAMWYQSRAGKCQADIIETGGLRRRPCERFAKQGSVHCPSHHGGFEPYDPQQATVAIAAFFVLVLL